VEVAFLSDSWQRNGFGKVQVIEQEP
jgi:hypothetical protein